MDFFSKLKEKFTGPKYEDMEQETGYVELENDGELSKSKVLVRPFMLEDFDDVLEDPGREQPGHHLGRRGGNQLRDPAPHPVRHERSRDQQQLG